MDIRPDELLRAFQVLNADALQRERLKLTLLIANKAAQNEASAHKATKSKLALANVMKDMYYKRWIEAAGWPEVSNTALRQRDDAIRQRDNAINLLNRATDNAQHANAQASKAMEVARSVQDSHADTLQLLRRAIAANGELKATIKHLRSQQAGSPAQGGVSANPPQHPDTMSYEFAKLRAENDKLKRNLLRAVRLLQQASATPTMAAELEYATQMGADLVKELHGWACDAHAQGLRVPDFDPRDYGTIENKSGRH